MKTLKKNTTKAKKTAATKSAKVVAQVAKAIKTMASAAKPAKQTKPAAKPAAKPAVKPVAKPAPRALTTEVISARAFTLWENAGRPTGRDTEFWLQAEQQLKGDTQSFAA